MLIYWRVAGTHIFISKGDLVTMLVEVNPGRPLVTRWSKFIYDGHGDKFGRGFSRATAGDMVVEISL